MVLTLGLFYVMEQGTSLLVAPHTSLGNQQFVKKKHYVSSMLFNGFFPFGMERIIFETGAKILVDAIYSNKDDISNFGSMSPSYMLAS